MFSNSEKAYMSTVHDETDVKWMYETVVNHKGGGRHIYIHHDYLCTFRLGKGSIKHHSHTQI